MNIARISSMNFNGAKAAMVKDAAKNANKKADQLLEEVLKPAEDFVNYGQSSYSVPTGDFPKVKMEIKRYPFSPDDNVIANEYLKTAEEAKKAEEVADFVSDGSIL